ncbi:MAG: hypothetical protein A2007_06305 [Verrucomicrobia bacterium GWC2_42_7]|nr:MAG: hypothetical protein A2007_06305 [Verrucomicrobia bacterium GWC2_42_7]
MRKLLPYWKYLKPHKKLFFTALLCGCISAIMSGFGIPVIFEKVFKQVFEDQGHKYEFMQVLSISLLVPAVFLTRGIFGFFATYLMSQCGMKILLGLREAVFDRIQKMSLGFFDKNLSGDLLSRIQSDPEVIKAALLEVASEIFRQPVQLAAAFAGLIYLSVKYQDTMFLIVFLVSLPLCYLPIQLVKKRVRKESRRCQDAGASVAQHITENVRSSHEIRAFNLQQHQQDSFVEKLMALIGRELKLIKYQKLQQPIMEFISAIMVAIVFIYGYRKQIPFSSFSALGVALYMAFDPVKRISNTFNVVHRSHGSIARVDEILQLPIDVPEPSEPRSFDSAHGEITFEKVSFSYGKEDVLEDVNIHIPVGQTCALVGHSGAGKTTFARLIPRFYDIQKGSIQIDGIDIRQVSTKDLRDKIAIVSQSPLLFNDTIFNNILIGKPSATREEVLLAAKDAFVDEFVAEFPLQFDTIVGEGGGRLSGGQRQRVAIARAFLKSAPILILDEATSALDANSEHLIQKALEILTKGKTVLTIAHRLSTIQHAQRILVFDKGRIVDQGTHSHLMATNPMYSDLVQKQSLDV